MSHSLLELLSLQIENVKDSHKLLLFSCLMLGQICTVIFTSYEVEQARLSSPNAIEVVHNNNLNGDQDIEDLVFNQTTEGYQVDETSLHEKTNADLQTKQCQESVKKMQAVSIDEEEEDNIKAEQGEFT